MIALAFRRLIVMALFVAAALMVQATRSRAAGGGYCGGLCPGAQCLDLEDYATGVCFINGNGYYYGSGTFYQCSNGSCTIDFGSCYLPDDVCPEEECCFGR